MPEGPEIRRAADCVRHAVANQPLRAVVFYPAALVDYSDRFDGTRITQIETRGKAMLTHFSNGLSVYTHNQLYGRWYCVENRQLPDTKRQLRLAIHASSHSALLYSASDIQVLSRSELAQHPFLKKLGPDVLGKDISPELIQQRLNTKGFQHKQLGSLLTDQSFVAGPGNYLRCEILHVCGLHPTTRADKISIEQQQRLAAAILAISRASYLSGGITNEPVRAQTLMQQGSSFESARFHVFRREAQPCYQCSTPIINIRQAGQACYLCPHCQKA